MTKEMTMRPIEELAYIYGVSEDSYRPVSKPRLTKIDKRYVQALKKKYKRELEGAKEMRIDLLNMIRGAKKDVVVQHLYENEEYAPLTVLMFNDEQLVVLWALRDKRLGETDGNIQDTV